MYLQPTYLNNLSIIGRYLLKHQVFRYLNVFIYQIKNNNGTNAVYLTFKNGKTN